MAARRERPVTDKARQEQGQRMLTERQQSVATVRDLLGQYTGKLGEVLPKGISPQKLFEIVMTEIAREPKLLECTRSSLIGAVIQTAQLGLLPGIVGEAYLIPFWNSRGQRLEVQLIPGYRGLLKLAYNSGQVAAVQAGVVREGDYFKFTFGTNAYMEHEPKYQGDMGDLPPLTHAYALVKLKGADDWIWDVLDRAKVMKARSSSQAANKGFSPWQTHEDEMWMKTALRHNTKKLPASIDRLQVASALDERAESGIAQELGALAPEVGDTPLLEGETVPPMEMPQPDTREREPVERKPPEAPPAEASQP